MCPYKDLPKDKLPLNGDDVKFLEELKVGW